MTLLLLACTCESWLLASKQEECHYQEVKDAYALGDETAFEAALARVPDPNARDLIRVRLAVSNPAQAASLCSKVSTTVAYQKCKQILGRPHLQDVQHGTAP
jgi:hypothetical protein